MGVVFALILNGLLRQSFFWGGFRRGRDREGLGPILLIIGLILAVLAPIATQLTRLTLSRNRKYLADAQGAMLTRYPPGLASALRKISEDIAKGVYSNNVMISHNKEKFIMDFLFVLPNMGTVNARVIVSPAHMKRILTAVKDNIAKYEKIFGKIQESEGPITKATSYH